MRQNILEDVGLFFSFLSRFYDQKVYNRLERISFLHFFRNAFAFLSKLAKKRIFAIIQVRFDNQYDLKRNITEFGNKISKALSHKRERSVVSKRAQIYARVESKF